MGESSAETLGRLPLASVLGQSGLKQGKPVSWGSQSSQEGQPVHQGSIQDQENKNVAGPSWATCPGRGGARL